MFRNVAVQNVLDDWARMRVGSFLNLFFQRVLLGAKTCGLSVASDRVQGLGFEPALHLLLFTEDRCQRCRRIGGFQPRAAAAWAASVTPAGR